METIKEERAYQYQGPPHWGLAWWFLSLHTKDKKMKPPRVVADLRSHLVVWEGIPVQVCFLHLPCMLPVLRGKWSGVQQTYMAKVSDWNSKGRFQGEVGNGAPI